MQFIAPDPAGTRAIVLIALLQGLMLYAAQELSDAWPFRDIGWRYCCGAGCWPFPARWLSLVESQPAPPVAAPCSPRRWCWRWPPGSAGTSGETALESGALQFR
jgi:hypothetical protein